MPVYWFALSQAKSIDILNAVLIFFILHLLVYPASNGYNSYMDEDKGSIGGIENPLPVNKELLYLSIIFDVAAILLSIIISLKVAIAVFIYIMASRLYSYRGVRLKKYPFLGYLTVVICQGALVYYTVSIAIHSSVTLSDVWFPASITSLLIAGTYPLTQVYQHEQDLADGVITLSYKLGVKATFLFSGLLLLVAVLLLTVYFVNTEQLTALIIYFITMIPVLIYFTKWFLKVDKDVSQANFKNLMTMNYVASVCSSVAFIAILVMKNL